MLISERIFDKLKKTGMSQKEFSQKTGIPQSTISDWKSKKLNPASDKIMLICEVLKVSPYELLSGVENENYTSLDYIIIDKNTDEYRLIEQYRSLGSERQARLLGYIEALSDSNQTKKQKEQF